MFLLNLKEVVPMKEHKRAVSFKARILCLALIPAFVMGIAVLQTGIFFVKSGMESEILKGLLSSAYAYKETAIQNTEREVGDNAIESELKKNTGYDFTWFDGDTRKNSSLGSSVIGTKAADTVIQEVIRNKKTFTSTSTQVAGQDYLVAYVPVMDENNTVVAMAFAGVSRESVQSAINRSVSYLLLIVIVLIIIASIVAFRSAISVSKAVKCIAESVNNLSEGEFVKADKFLDRTDEIGSTLNSTNTLLDKLTEVVKNIHDASDTVGSQANELAGASSQIKDTTEGVSQAVQEMARGASEQSEAIQNASQNIAELSDAIQDVADNAESLATTAKNMNEASQSSAEALNNLSHNMEAMEQSVESIAQTMNDTNQAVQEVNRQVEDITSIASQTNLLALNASIEAARAGDAGKGFSVVAEEIGKLATESAQTADIIKKEMANLLEKSTDAIKKTEDITQIRNDVSTVLTDTVSKINDLISNVDNTVTGVTKILSLAEKCDASKGVIIDAMTSLSAISEESAASTEETSASMEELNATIVMLAQSANDLKDVAEKLETDLSFFKLSK